MDGTVERLSPFLRSPGVFVCSGMRKPLVCLLFALCVPVVARSADPLMEVVIPTKMSPADVVRAVSPIFSRHRVQVTFVDHVLGVVSGDLVLRARATTFAYKFHVSTDGQAVRVLVYFSPMFSNTTRELDEDDAPFVQPVLDELKKLGSSPAEPR